MNICIIAYNQMALHSISILTFFLRDNGISVHLIADTDVSILTREKIQIKADLLAEETCFDDYDGIVIPGGITDELLEIDWLKSCLESFDKRHKPIGSICAGTQALAECGILKGRNYTSSYDFSSLHSARFGNNIKKTVIKDNNIITARGQSFVEFAIDYLEMLGCVDKTELRRLRKRYRPAKIRIKWGYKEYEKKQ